MHRAATPPGLGARLTLDPDATIGAIDRRLFGSFVEHLGRGIYDGIHEPSHPLADEWGFRTDVLELVRELGVSTIRYPGGNFVSGYRWEDGIGPRHERPTRLDLAWHSTETNQVGLDEFAAWAERAGADVMLAVNLGTRGVAEALDLLEYTNIPGGTTWSDARIAHGRTAPYDVRMWCLGNEMDGPWQLGHRSADDYGKLAARTARAMRQLDPSLELVVCGSSSSRMPTFGAWERTVLQHTYDDVDHISCHAYYELEDDDMGSFLASAVDMDRFIDTVVATADQVGAERRSAKRIQISFDEWNVWYFRRYEEVDKITGTGNWPVAPRLLEDTYTVADAVVVGSLLVSLLRHADRVTSASMAQLVNVIAPITTEPGAHAWRQTTFFPFATTSRLARGSSLDVAISSSRHVTAARGEVDVVDAVATWDETTGRSAVFLVNRDEHRPATVTIDVSRLPVTRVTECRTLSDDDPFAINTVDDPERVQLIDNTTAELTDGRVSVVLPPVSWTALALAG
ncbi:arabinosylfuranosidase ArfA [Nocardioides baculatus]|uniref:non-reducing end alpha-L-arabinofuranosidase n=1 Tax=Nocardioides baculatus TaxID=2801337 RepID=A0ABS1L408_9ACTN|nr:alpha-N-arabinofuranosidase [Nocardioides baculatus]MBL0746426.1 alpha-N-arabinofuranosidase [Nocardioides baculatus]